MKLSPYMNIKRVEFVVTWQCGGRCRHCQVGTTLNKAEEHRYINAQKAMTVLAIL